MNELSHQAESLQAEIDQTLKKLSVADLERQKEELDEQINSSDFWRDNLRAQSVMKQKSKIERRLKPWQELQNSLREIREMSALNDASLADDLSIQLDQARSQYESLKEELKFRGKYDEYDVIIGIYAGAGGTDAQDWVQMLLRMYTRWAERNQYQITTIEYSAGDEAGIKSVTFEMSGPFLYGKLKGEQGVHRLVRLSPFNADHLRQTSFAKVDILPKIDHPEALAIDNKDLRIDVYRAAGHGGQSVNTTDSAVRVTHLPTGISVAIQNERSQLQNKETALTVLRSRLAQLQLEQHKEKIDEIKGPNQSAEWGNQIRNYVLHPYKQVKDLRTNYETSDVDSVLDGQIEPLINAYLEHNLAS